MINVHDNDELTNTRTEALLNPDLLPDAVFNLYDAFLL
jgi:hypothetical protein